MTKNEFRQTVVRALKILAVLILLFIYSHFSARLAVASYHNPYAQLDVWGGFWQVLHDFFAPNSGQGMGSFAGIEG